MLLFAACASGATAPTAGESSVRPGINDTFLAPDLDVEQWIERFEGESREIFVERDRIVEALSLRPGMEIGDIGAGTGLFVGPFADAVGPQGRVYAVDIAPRFLEHLRARVEAQGLSQVSVVEGGERSVELTKDSIDLAFVCDVYHHFEYPQASLASLRSALRPGGILLVIDFERIPGVSSEFILGHVRAGKQVFVDEIESAGFVLEEELAVDGLVENYVLRFRNP